MELADGEAAPRPGPKAALKVLLQGFVIGAACALPAFSPGTVACLAGVYGRGICGLDALATGGLRRLGGSEPAGSGRGEEARFLALLAAGILIGLLAVADLVARSVSAYPIPLQSLLFGLVLGTAPGLARCLGAGQFGPWMVLLLASLVPNLVRHLVPLEFAGSAWLLFLGGLLSGCGWLLPGLSGSLLLMVLGLYPQVTAVLEAGDFEPLMLLLAGCALGAMGWARIVASSVRASPGHATAALGGLMLGSLPCLWPWQHTASYQLIEGGDPVPLVSDMLLPWAYTDLTGRENLWPVALACALAGLVLASRGPGLRPAATLAPSPVAR